jgi:hypothetical protein
MKGANGTVDVLNKDIEAAHNKISGLNTDGSSSESSEGVPEMSQFSKTILIFAMSVLAFIQFCCNIPMNDRIITALKSLSDVDKDASTDYGNRCLMVCLAILLLISLVFGVIFACLTHYYMVFVWLLLEFFGIFGIALVVAIIRKRNGHGGHLSDDQESSD